MNHYHCFKRAYSCSHLSYLFSCRLQVGRCFVYITYYLHVIVHFLLKYLKDVKPPPFGAKLCLDVSAGTLFVPQSSRNSAENATLTDHVPAQISEYSFAPNGGYSLFIPCSKNMASVHVIFPGVFI